MTEIRENGEAQTPEPITRQELRWRIWQQLPLLVVLVLLWMMLWGSLTPLTIVTGILVAVGVTRAFYLPPVELSGRFNPLWFAVFLGRFLLELVKASSQVAWRAFSPRPIGRSSVVAVQLLTRSDFITTLAAIAVSLIPGSMVIEVDRAGGVLYLHAIGAAERDEIDKVRADVLAIESLLVRALGSKDDLRSIG
jgi:multicomponent Na+:H+ antiporter subunit E